jgi:hypothetical protein
VQARQVGTAFHGDVFAGTCWEVGDPVANEVAVPLPGGYTSTVWFRILQWSGDPAYVPDTRFSRTGRSDRLDLPRCARPPE